MVDDADQTVAGGALKTREGVVVNSQLNRISHRRCCGYLCRPDQDVPLQPDGVGFLLIHESLQLEDKDAKTAGKRSQVLPATADGFR